jgi:hypothetical protein
VVIRGLVLAALLLQSAAGQYSGSAACGECHPKQYSEQAKSGHARSLSKTSEHTLALLFPGKPGDWAFGAGDQAVTFVSRLNDEHYVEHGLTYYTRTKQMAATPGHTATSGVKYRTFDPDAAILRCFQCHSTGPLKLESGSTIVPFENGVRCESCHGPGEEHARSKGSIANPKRLSATQVNDLCGSCHRKISKEEPVNWNDAWNVRHQPLYFAQSRCFLKSAGKLSCFTCHAPHAAVSRSASDYSQVCASCHEGVRHKTAILNQGCTACHMPVVKLDEALQFANHWIGVYAQRKTLRPVR